LEERIGEAELVIGVSDLPVGEMFNVDEGKVSDWGTEEESREYGDTVRW
jgi:hypothetical protein